MGLIPLYRALALAYYRCAMRQIHPLHPDVPELVRRISDLERTFALPHAA